MIVEKKFIFWNITDENSMILLPYPLGAPFPNDEAKFKFGY